MEESLVNTVGQSLIHDLYHGKMTNTIECGSCGAVSERDEDFLDLCVSVSGSSTLQNSLAATFLDTEVLDASNQYRCDTCGQLTDAKKSTRLRHVPPVLTVSLLRFNYDPVKMERYKETGHFEFPSRLDMSAFCNDDRPASGGKEITSGKPCDQTGSGECCGDHPVMNGIDHGDKQCPGSASVCGDSADSETKAVTFGCTYELFSVVVHRGGAHGGHYRALIRDLDVRGCWIEPDNATKQDMTVTSSTDHSHTAPCSNGIATDDLDLTSPRSVVTSILLASGGVSGISVAELSEKIISTTGQSWKKKYKPRHGSLAKFLAENGDLFHHDSVNGWLTLVPGVDTSQVQKKSENEAKVEETDEVSARPVPVQHPAKPNKRKAARAVQCEKLDVSSPKSVISCLLRDAGEAGLSVTDLCSKISDATGQSWRKRFKPKHGSLVKFLADNTDQFIHDVSGGWVSLVPARLEMTEMSDANGNEQNGSDSSEVIQHQDVSSSVTATKLSGKQRKKRSKLKASVQGETVTLRENLNVCKAMASMSLEELPSRVGDQCWFDFNDSTIRPVLTEDIQKHFSGKECAYMLFYRAVPPTDTGPVAKPMEIPDWLISEITAENQQLEQQRAEYEDSVNVVPVEIHFGRLYEYHENMLRPRVGTCYYVEQTVDVRMESSSLLQVVSEIGGELVEQCCTVHVAKTLPYGGLHLYQEVTGDPPSSLKSSGVVQGSKLFVWNGREVEGTAVPVGCENEPVAVKFEVEKSREAITVNVAKNTTILALRGLVANRLLVHNAEKIQLLHRPKGAESGLVLLDLSKTVSEAGLHAKDKIIVRHLGLRTTSRSAPSSPVSPSTTRNVLPRNITVCCENHVGSDVVVVEVEAESASSVQELKVLVMTSADLAIEQIADVRLRLRPDDFGIGGMGLPLHEGVDLATAGLSDGATLVLEHGRAPRDTEVTLTAFISASSQLELTADDDMPIHQLLHQVVMLAGTAVEGSEWHLCRSDWTGDAGPVLNDPNRTVGDAGLRHGDQLYLRPGCPAPPGFNKIFIHLMSSPTRPCWWDPEKGCAAAAIVQPDPVGSVVLSKMSTLADLKQQVTTILPDAGIPSPQFMRLQSLTSKLQPAGILRQHSQMLTKMRVGDGCALGVEVLPSEEDLRAEQLVLVVRRRLPGERSYADCAQEVVWDTSHGASITSLRSSVAETIGETENCVRMAKHIPDKFEWLVIPHTGNAASFSDDPTFCTVRGGKKKRKRKGSNAKSGGGARSAGSDLKSAPFHLQDGDVIGVKIADEPGGEDSDFGSTEDDLGKELMRSRQSEAAALREAMKRSETKSPPTSGRRPETTIKIHVDNFR